MFVFDTWTPEEFHENVRIVDVEAKPAIFRDLRTLLNAPEDLPIDALSALVQAKARYVADVKHASDPLVWDLALASGIPLTPELTLYEAQLSGLPGLFAGDAQRWLSNVLDWWTPGAEDLVCFGQDMRFVLVLTHSFDLCIGDLADEEFNDPDMLAIAARLRNPNWKAEFAMRVKARQRRADG
jgi:hypothetical protein